MRYQDDKEIIDTFITECQDHLEDLESGILALEENVSDDNLVHNMFRAAHSIKASANLLEFKNIESIAFCLEEVLQEIRIKKTILRSEQVSLFLKSLDRLGELVENLERSDLLDISPLVNKLNEMMRIIP